MKRRKFIRSTFAAAVLPGVISSCNQPKKIKGRIIGASFAVGHLLRDKQFAEPFSIEKKRVVIVGGGVSGLSAARHLLQNGERDFALLELEQKEGGNAANGKNDVSAYPWGAHYIPIPNNDLTEYLQFLEETGVITGYDNAGLPIYNEYYLCFDPQDRLYINGSWQEGLVPNFGVPDNDKKQIARFLNVMNDFKRATGTDGRQSFSIPVDASSGDASFAALDNQTMKEWMQQNGFSSEYLHWYVNYCTRDDFGTPSHLVSAWAGIHYFASRKGKAANAAEHDILTWPEGNGFLINSLAKDARKHVRTNALAVRVQLNDGSVSVDYFDVEAKALKRIEAEHCILAIPQFIASRLLNDAARTEEVKKNFHYMPWMVANIRVKNLEERSGAPLSWDNVLYGSDSLGYVEATHELTQQHLSVKNLTYYLPLTNKDVVDERKIAQQKTHEEWVKIITDDLKLVHPNIESAIEELSVMIWGHAMVQPLPGLIKGGVRQKLSASISNRLHFAHTDLAGISIFEEGFCQGLKAAKQVLNHLTPATNEQATVDR